MYVYLNTIVFSYSPWPDAATMTDIWELRLTKGTAYSCFSAHSYDRQTLMFCLFVFANLLLAKQV